MRLLERQIFAMPNNYQGIVPYLYFDDARAALDWYREHFGFEEVGCWADEQGRVQNAEMRAGKTEIWLDGSGRLKKEDDRPIWVGIWVDDVDAIHRMLVAKGVECDKPVDRDFGVRMLNVDDGMGHLWGFIKRIAEATAQ